MSYRRRTAQIHGAVDVRLATVLNGAQGIGEIMNQVIGQAGPALELARNALGPNGYGRHGAPGTSGEPKGASGN